MITNNGQKKHNCSRMLGSTILPYPRLHNIIFSENITLYKVKGEVWGRVRFRTTLWGEIAAQWESLECLVQIVTLNYEPNKVG